MMHLSKEKHFDVLLEMYELLDIKFKINHSSTDPDSLTKGCCGNLFLWN
ncbi:hypothetical protein [Bacillus sp. BA3]|nr:hypothetical protein [Bacillus sp. BA3]